MNELTRARAIEPIPYRPYHNLGSVGHAQLMDDAPDVDFNRRVSDIQRMRDDLILVALAELVHDLPFPIAQGIR